MVYHTVVASSVTVLPSRGCQKLTLSAFLILKMKTRKQPMKQITSVTRKRKSDLRVIGLSKKCLKKNCILLFSDFCVNCKVFRAVAVSHRHPSKDTQGHVNYFSWKKTLTQSVSSHLHLNYDMTDLVGHQAIITFDTVKSR